jgi:hypothetical protein
VVGGERERQQRRSRVRGVAFLTRAAPRQKVEEGGGEKKKSIPNFLLLAPHDRCTVTTKSQNQAFFSAETRRVFSDDGALWRAKPSGGRDS